MINSSISLGIYDGISPKSYQFFQRVSNIDFSNRSRYRFQAKVLDNTTLMSVNKVFNSTDNFTEIASSQNNDTPTPKKIPVADINDVNLNTIALNTQQNNEVQVDPVSNYSSHILRRFKPTDEKAAVVENQNKPIDNNSDKPKIDIPEPVKLESSSETNASDPVKAEVPAQVVSTPVRVVHRKIKVVQKAKTVNSENVEKVTLPENNTQKSIEQKKIDAYQKQNLQSQKKTKIDKYE